MNLSVAHFENRLPGGVRFAGAFFHDADQDPHPLVAAFEKYRPPVLLEIEGLDRHLADHAAAVCPPWARAVGLSLHIPGMGGPTGGLVGDPRRMPLEADGREEELGNGLACVARPGGPGLVVQGKLEQARALTCEWVADLSEGGNETILTRLAISARKMGIDQAMVVEDGCGPGKDCRIVVLSAGGIWSAFS
jgi:hypothetical protein